MNLVSHFETNTAGRDFVVGDLHGCLDLFKEVLFIAAFDPSVDRVFSVGDLIDRGPDSAGCIDLLNEPWFHPVRGNHEDFLIGYMEGRWRPHVWMQNGGIWAASFSDAQLSKWASKLNQLPFVIAVGSGECRFNVLHAEFFGTDDEIDAGSVDPSADDAAILWGRSLISGYGLSKAGTALTAAGFKQPGLSTTYVGHTIVPTVKRIGSHVFIDTGAYRHDGALTLIEPATGRKWTACREEADAA